jgi:hypothetical protein
MTKAKIFYLLIPIKMAVFGIDNRQQRFKNRNSRNRNSLNKADKTKQKIKETLNINTHIHLSYIQIRENSEMSLNNYNINGKMM